MTKALFWDFDGTLIHPNESFLNAMQNALQAYEYRVTVEETRQFLHSVCSWYTPEISYADNTGEKWWVSLFNRFHEFYENHCVAENDFDKVNAEFRRQITELRINTVLYTDTITVLQKCIERGYKNYILSNNYPELPLTVKELGLSDFFTNYIVSANVGYEKPRIELFKYALEIANTPVCSYMIGDNPVADIQGGKLAGMKTIYVHSESPSGADFMCKDLIDVLAILSL